MGLPRVTALLEAEMTRTQRKKIPIRVLAADIGLSPAALYNYVQGRVTPDVESLKKLAKYFNTTVGDLIGEEYASSSIRNKTAAEEMFETTITGRPADEQLQLMSLWLKLVKDFDRKKI